MGIILGIKQTGLVLVACLVTSALRAAPPAIGAAPKGGATAVATRIIKYNFPACRHVSHAVRAPDGSIAAMCDGTAYRVFTIFDPQEGKALEVAMNCSAAKAFLHVSCSAK